jgi:putative hemolysin
LLIVLAIIGVHAYFVITEYALVTLRHARLQQMAASGSRGALLVLDTLGRLPEVIAAVQLGVTIASLLLGALAEPVVAHLLEPLFGFIPKDWQLLTAAGVSVALAFIVITAVDIVLGELVPKTVALAASERVAIAVIRPIRWFIWLFQPFIALLNASAGAVLRAFRLRQVREGQEVNSPEELKLMIASSTRAGVLDADEQEMLFRTFEFARLTARQVMVPRTEVIGLPIDADRDLVADTIRQTRHTRYPVFRGSLDEIVGILYVRDLLGRFPNLAGGFDLRALMREPLIVPDSVHLDDLLSHMRRMRVHFAVVSDEYGGTAGIATLEDVLERIVGEVRDEFETSGAEIQETTDGALIDGLVLVADVNARFDLRLDEDAYDTLGGLMWGELGREPHPGDELAIGRGQLRIEQMDGRRVASVRLIRTKDADSADSAHSSQPD